MIISHFENFSASPEDVSIDAVIQEIKGGKYKQQIVQLREYEKGNPEYDRIKKNLPHFTASGSFLNGRKQEDLYDYSGIIVLDIDDISDPEALKGHLSKEEYVHFAFISPGGKGLKVGVRVSTGKDYHETAFKQLVGYMEEEYEVKVDRSGKDLSRACFYSYDPDMHYNPEAKAFDVDTSMTQMAVTDAGAMSDDIPGPMEAIFGRIDEEAQFMQSVEGRNNHCHQFACICNRKGVDRTHAIEYFVQVYEEEDFTRAEIERTITGAYKRYESQYGNQSEYQAFILDPNPNPSSNGQLSSSDLHKIAEEIRRIKKTDIPEEKPLIRRNGESMVFKNSIVMVQGKKGSFKSRLAQAILASVLAGKSICLKGNLEMVCTESNVVGVYIDTERSFSHQFPKAIQDIQNIVCINKKNDPSNFEYTSLVSTNRKQRLKKLQSYLQDLQKKYEGKHLVVVIDVVTDLCVNFNDPVESMAVIDYLNSMINYENCTFICVIHENPGGGSKARGHVGTEMGNKATTQLQVKKIDLVEGKGVRIRYLKCRNTEEYPDFYAKYDPGLRRLIEVKSEEALTDESQLKASHREVCEYLSGVVFPIDRQELLSEISDEFDITERTVIERIKEIVDKKIPILIDEVEHVLFKEKSKKVTYKLKEKNSEEEGQQVSDDTDVSDSDDEATEEEKPAGEN